MSKGTETEKSQEVKRGGVRYSFNEHGALMDGTYRYMKHVYDISRPAFLAGRAQARRDILAFGAPHICEIGSGTGRNLILMARSPLGRNVQFLGLDVSQEMISFAKEKISARSLNQQIQIRLQDFLEYSFSKSEPCSFLFSYSLSMIPNWQDVLRAAATMCRENGGVIVIADFSTMERWPMWIRERLRKNLTYFHVYPRFELASFLKDDTAFAGARTERTAKFGGYAAVSVVSF